MKIYLHEQEPFFAKHLKYLSQQPVTKYDKSLLKEKVNTISINKPHLSTLNIDCLFNYQIFPPHIMAYKTEWQNEQRDMRVGDSIVQQVYIPPIKSISQKLIFGVRIKEIINTDTIKGFSYETLEGHVEKGLSIFTLEQWNDNIIFKIHTYSGPGNIISKIVAPFFSIPYQAYCTKAALKNIKAQIEL